MIEQEKIDQALIFLGGWYRCYADLVDSVPPNRGKGPSQHNIKSRDNYRNAMEVIESLRALALSQQANRNEEVSA
ncbi:hypothetical protein ACFKHW_32035 [Bradyrhizobium lupini]|uniref:hypothetical protein n=1 Tax=Rhizobium lupini TaxID=136996 RepID=UPI00366E9A17